ncbi:tRNA/rRNA cytosine-C5-methylase, NOL1/NOP2/Sun family [Thermococcus kodakarensis KOD1]|uniref:tRNA/rRNA cytosine-C5-methylase, NOL1/NOP2/Sun family n=1 Tax=Thermococcus kodakarensis (strain ATCC BAA-918 / JCM 12380 / KOD1) TaxID=69014 RepID=Q5JDP5_THEKO|nr:RsmB/NOP family class I SAM-dependent RNA methyltransferase [Thermococcus kodakarensis]WCN27822.1 RsmB/NOP family class I SAM-dependent RNA methyltransferase [Thermococcus kodakarensis]WCN30120.1 RsmB/NOP family class I SAM-dependent RNA methyltransferase [Thermococcus kodakarensis]BAD86124.1 tRNA/rRNA cytosine-C5-methylase, NOL1/NOP2/Sun family [Thermococcus kodakarensis KOD1]
MPKLKLSDRQLYALIEALKLGEEVKPSQQAKRRAFSKYRIEGWENSKLTGIFYSIQRRLGLIDEVIEELVGVSPLILDPWLRAALRVAVEVGVFREPSERTLQHLKGVAQFLSKRTHPYVGYYYYDLLPRVVNYVPKLDTEEKRLKWEYLFPEWFIARMRALLGEEAEELLRALNETLPTSIRVNRLRTSVEEVENYLRKKGVRFERSERVNTVIRILDPFNPEWLFNKGYAIAQEEASAVASLVLAPKPGETVVDLAAAPGGKTAHMAELMENRGKIYAFDVDSARIKRMKEVLKRTGVEIAEVIKADGRNAPELLGEEIADRVLLDAPCTSDGTIAKNPELRWRLREKNIPKVVALQKELMESAWKLLKPGGRLLYSTCSMLPEENEEVVKWFLERHPGAELVPLNGPYDPGFLKGTMRAWPHRHRTIGFFYALIEKRRSESRIVRAC